MSEENNKSQNENQPRRFNQKQYDLLKKCSDKKDITEWNEYRINNPDVDIELEGANFEDWDISGAFLQNGYVKVEGKTIHLSGSIYLKDTNFSRANLEGALFMGAHLEMAKFTLTNLEGTRLFAAYLHKADFRRSFVSSKTILRYCRVDKKTDFRDVAVDSILIDSGRKQLLKYNIRRMNWEQWYKEHKILRWPVWLFWQMSDYGSSSLRIIGCFFGLAFGFAIIYRIWPGLVMVKGGADHLRDFIHALYFSVVTMTTLGFGDIAANPDSHCGQILLMVQVILGYVLLGALITRLAVLFTGEGPAGKFADEKKKESTDKGNDFLTS